MMRGKAKLRTGLICGCILLAVVTITGFVTATDFINPVGSLLTAADLERDFLVNANRTGFDWLVKSNPSLIHPIARVHQIIYTNPAAGVFDAAENTNSCATCHTAHVSSGRPFLVQNSQFIAGGEVLTSSYNTCISCHGGAIGYNVLQGMTLENNPAHWSGAGRLFEGAGGGSDVSFHLATGARRHGDAPGANVSLPGNWSQPLTCSSCHGPHGTYSGRLLHYNPNGRAVRHVNLPLVSLGGGVYRIADTSLTPWLFSSGHAAEVHDSVYNRITDQFVINYARGQLTRVGSGTAEPAFVTFYRAQVLGMTIENLYSTRQESPERVIHTSGVNQFCLSCHANYTVGERVYHVYFNHRIGMDVTASLPVNTRAVAIDALALEKSDGTNRLTCLTCHYAHGTDLSRMRRRAENWGDSYWALERLTDRGYVNPIHPTNTNNLRFFDPDNADGFNGRREVCFLCHATAAEWNPPPP